MTMHLINKLYTEQYDFPIATNSNNISYMIASVPRSGSTLLSIQLWRTGLLGSPLEYLNFQAMAEQIQRFGIDGSKTYSMSKEEITKYWKKLKDVRTSANGVFGFKMFMTNLSDVVDFYPEFFEQVQPDYVIYLTRKDILEQAISYSRAIRTRTWFADTPNVPDVPYDYAHILSSIESIKMQYDFWEKTFSQSNINPIRINYEELIQDHASVVDFVLSRMDIKRDVARELIIPETKLQRDSTTENWKSRFERDHSSKGLSNVEINVGGNRKS